MKIKTTVSETTLAEYDKIMGEHIVSEPYMTNGDCFADFMEDEIEINPEFVLDIDYLDAEMQSEIERFKEMIAEAAWNEEPDVPDARKEHARFKRQHFNWKKNAKNCPGRTIEI